MAKPPNDSVVNSPGYSNDALVGVQTGDGGFDVGDGVTRTYEPANPDADPTTKPRTKTVNVGYTTDGVPNDLPKKTIETLGNYISTLTKGLNVQPISPGQQIVSSADFKADSPVVQAGSAFIQDTTNVAGLDPYTEAGKNTLGNLIKSANEDFTYGGLSVDGYRRHNGNTFLKPSTGLVTEPGVQPGEPNFRDGEADPTSTYVSEVIAKTGRWGQVGRFSPEFLQGGGVADEGALIVDRRDGYSRFGRELGAVASPIHLKSIGPALTQIATGEISSKKGDMNPQADAGPNQLIPGLEQLTAANTIDAVALEARSAFEKIINNPDAPNEFSISDTSWGVLNNIDDNFTGVGMQFLALAQFAVVKLAVSVVTAVIGGVAKGTSNVLPYDEYNKGKDNLQKVYGQHLIYEDSVATFLGITPPRNGTWGDTVDYGFNIFFAGFDNATVDKALLSFVLPLANDNGSRVVRLRALVRSVIFLVERLKQLIGSGIGLLLNIFEIISAIKTSQIFAALNAFSKLGDIYAYRQNLITKNKFDARGLIIPNQNGESSSPSFDSLKKDIPPGTLLTDLPFSWQNYYKDSEMSTRRSFSFLMPRIKLGELNLKEEYSSFGVVFAAEPALVKDWRLTQNAVIAIEEGLSAEYFPFYFHDLRTNEIVSFHAFLASLTDGYQASYEQIEGIGRVEPVKHYKSTTRKFGFSFYIVATNDDQIPAMYEKINKLTTLLYPQYTAGKVIFSEDKRFIQPFSQVPGAAPLIRIRLGDIARSNYSKFALARLFGAGLDASKYNLENSSPITNPAEKLKWFAYPKKTSSKGYVKISLKAPIGGQVSDQYINDQGWFCIFDEFPKDDIVKCKVQMMKDFVEDVTGRSDAITRSVSSFVGKDIYVHRRDLSFTDLLVNKKELRDSIENNFESQNGITQTNMLDANKSAIVRHFENNAGKGLAGYIESMDFDWFTHTRWNTGRQARDTGFVPMMCKITISFSPVHDISPGLDSQGYNRAPIYPVKPANLDKKGY